MCRTICPTGGWSMERCRYFWKSWRSNAVHADYMVKLPFVFFLQRRVSQIKITPFGEDETLCGPADTCMWIFWVWMCTILLHKRHQFWLFSFLCHAAAVDTDLFTVNLATALQEYTWLFFFINQLYSDYIDQTNFWFIHQMCGDIYLIIFFLFSNFHNS